MGKIAKGKVFCKDCIHIIKPAGAMYEPHPESICLSPNSIRPNFVTGKVGAAKCKDINPDGMCKFFEFENSGRFAAGKEGNNHG